jgi:predicted tellurium resistance membrane protein TerC
MFLDSVITLCLLVSLELVLGIDNILVISIFVGKLPEGKRNLARVIGLSFALIARLLMLVIMLTLSNLKARVVLDFSPRDILLLMGGLFLLWKAVTEVHHTVELKEGKPRVQGVSSALGKLVFQIVLLDIVFSIDSVITAVGLTNQIWVIIFAVLLSFIAILFVSRPIGDFILRHPALKILALSFLITIGVTLFMEGMHKHVPKAYIYLPMGFALFVEVLQMRQDYNMKKRQLGNGEI